ncbi:hypothetical protein CK203_033061 [Vitis vinifera]|uniref:Uncharacterized protein n=1 Tax=Vitis vinifera TaxID=29760 RepID=A0A438HVZ4_VITVI|nr:hypothetical protein CK203_033061 [Vitis vinifera]
MSEGQGEAKSQVCEAARKGDTAKLRALIDSGADVSFFDGEGLNPLMHAARLGHADVVKILLETGVPWNALFPSNLSASNFAMDSGHQEAFELVTSTSCCLDVEVSHHNNSSSTSKSLLSMYRSFILNLTMGPHHAPLSSTTIFYVGDATVSLTTATRIMS